MPAIAPRLGEESSFATGVTYQFMYESAYFFSRERYRIRCKVSYGVIEVDVIPHDCEMH
jgi:hypothetical protein